MQKGCEPLDCDSHTWQRRLRKGRGPVARKVGVTFGVTMVLQRGLWPLQHTTPTLETQRKYYISSYVAHSCPRFGSRRSPVCAKRVRGSNLKSLACTPHQHAVGANLPSPLHPISREDSVYPKMYPNTKPSWGGGFRKLLIYKDGGPGTRTPMCSRTAVFKTAALPVRSSPPRALR